MARIRHVCIQLNNANATSRSRLSHISDVFAKMKIHSPESTDILFSRYIVSWILWYTVSSIQYGCIYSYYYAYLCFLGECCHLHLRKICERRRCIVNFDQLFCVHTGRCSQTITATRLYIVYVYVYGGHARKRVVRSRYMCV